MEDEIFYDTNVLYYAYDLSEPEKRKNCKSLVSKVFLGYAKGVISNQILVELHNAPTRKLGVEPDTARVIVDSFIASENWRKVSYSNMTVKAALEISKAFRAPFLDSLIAETMKENGINQIITENENDFIRIPGIKIKNPLR